MDDFGEVFECPLTWYENNGIAKIPWISSSLEPLLSSETSCRLSAPQPQATPLLPPSSSSSSSAGDVVSVRETHSHSAPALSHHHYSHHDLDDAFLVSQWTQALGLQASLLPSTTTECCYQQQIGGADHTHLLRDDMQIELHNNPTKRAGFEGCWVSSHGNKLNQEKPQQMKCAGQYGHSQGGGATSSATGGASKPRQRARRGQATDPHSIAERLRRERIANRIKALQELVPHSNKVDRISLLDDIIDYVRFLQLQAKVFSMSRLGGAGAIAPLVADISEGQSSNDTIGTHRPPQKDDMEVTEQEVAKLMEADISLAMRYLQSKGLCLMPISLVSAIPSMDNKHSTDDSEVYTSCV